MCGGACEEIKEQWVQVGSRKMVIISKKKESNLTKVSIPINEDIGCNPASDGIAVLLSTLTKYLLPGWPVLLSLELVDIILFEVV